MPIFSNTHAMDTNPRNDDDGNGNTHHLNIQLSVPEIEDRISRSSSSSYAPSSMLRHPYAMSSDRYLMDANSRDNDGYNLNNTWNQQLSMPEIDNHTYQPSGLSYTPVSSAPYQFVNPSGRGRSL